MISTTKKISEQQSISTKDRLNLNSSPQLIARWQMVDGNLICQWIKV